VKVGIPRGLFYFYHYPLWKTFFRDLGVEVEVSSDTNRTILDNGIQLALDETCLPVKVYYGHVWQLCNRQVDYIFLPRIVSVEPKSYICPKFMGVPDMVKAAFPNLPPVIDCLVDVSRGYRSLESEIIRIGKIFGRRTRQIKEAYRHGLEELYFCQTLAADGYTLNEAIKVWEGHRVEIGNARQLNLGVLGHGYSLYDDTVSMNIIKRLREMGCRICLPESIPIHNIEAAAATLPKRIFWTLGRKMVGSALCMDRHSEIHGIIYVACFGCGPDSMVGEIIERKIKNKAFMLITIDEHTGEGGLITRLEAFCDMLLRRRLRSSVNNLSSHGECPYTN
jgi:predicted nucleotide-binding protein (sugar kinase/HSP70/actin superfamily)